MRENRRNQQRNYQTNIVSRGRKYFLSKYFYFLVELYLLRSLLFQHDCFFLFIYSLRCIVIGSAVIIYYCKWWRFTVIRSCYSCHLWRTSLFFFPLLGICFIVCMCFDVAFLSVAAIVVAVDEEVWRRWYNNSTSFL